MKIFLIAGEASGDVLGARLICALKEKLKEKLEVSGIGGERMEEMGMKSLFPMKELSLLGFVEIIPHIPKLLSRINQAAEEILKIKPDVVVTIDAPAFNNRVARKLNKLGARKMGIRLIHYVAPTVWAYKPERAEKISKLYDHLIALLPFEPPYFEKAGLPCSFAGHPVMEEEISGGNGNDFRKRYGIEKNAELLCILPGSRNSEIARMTPIFGDTVAILSQKIPGLNIVIIAAAGFRKILESATKYWAAEKIIVIEKDEKRDAYAASDLALAKSGTATLELAIAGVPMVVAYKVNWLSAWMLKRMIHVKFVNIINLLRNREIVPEFLQDDCVPEKIAARLEMLFLDKYKAKIMAEQCRSIVNDLKVGETKPSCKAAEVVLKLTGLSEKTEKFSHS